MESYINGRRYDLSGMRFFGINWRIEHAPSIEHMNSSRFDPAVNIELVPVFRIEVRSERQNTSVYLPALRESE